MRAKHIAWRERMRARSAGAGRLLFLSAWRMSAHSILIDVGAPPGPRRHDDLAVLDLRRVGDQIVAPGDLVHIVLHDAVIRDRRAEMRADHAREMAGEIVRGAVDLERVGQRCGAY